MIAEAEKVAQDKKLAKKVQGKVRRKYGSDPNPAQARRVQPGGPNRVICSVIDVVTGRVEVEAAGLATRKESALARSRQNALRALKKKLRRHFAMDDYKLAYRGG